MRTNGASRPLIGLTVGAAQAKDGLDYARLRMTYVHAVEDAGGLPVLIPPLADASSLAAVLERIDGLLLPGGADVDPAEYGESMNGGQEVNAGLDHLELAAVRCAVERELPTLGICRGQQVINVALGGTLIQHMDGHAPSGPRDALHHGFRIAPGTKLAALLGGSVVSDVRVNSHHHQAVKALGEGLVAVAWSEDGTIEGIEAPGHRWLVAVQFHPEDLVPLHPASRTLLEQFVAACQPRTGAA